MSSLTEPRALHGYSPKLTRLSSRARRHRSPSNPIDISVIVAAHNEAENLQDLYQELVDALGDQKWELVIVDDGSADDTYEVAVWLYSMDSRVTIVRLRRNFGKTAALSAGISVARGDVVVTIDGDLQDDPREIPKLLEALNSGLDLVTGWRLHRQDSLSKRLSSLAFNGLVSKLTGVHLHDMNCGLKACWTRVAKDLKLYGELHRFMPVLANQKGYRVGEVEVHHRPRLHGKSKYGWERAIASFLDIQMVLFLTRYLGKPLRLFGTAGSVLLGLGTLSGVYLSFLRFSGEHIGSRPLLFLSVLLVLSGLQLISTGLIGEMLQNINFDRRKEYSIETLLRREPVAAGKMPSPNGAE